MKKYEKNDLILMLQNGRTLEEIGFIYGVSRQRIYQVLTKFGISTPEKIRKRNSTNWTAAQKWLWRTLCSRGAGTKVDRMEIFEKIDLPVVCPVLGIKLDYEGGKGIRGEDSPSIDRIDSKRGYTANNVIIICWRANRLKNDGTPEEHLKIAEYYKNLQNSI